MPLTEDQIAHAGRQLAARRGFTQAAAVGFIRSAEATWNEIAALVEPEPTPEAEAAPVVETPPELEQLAQAIEQIQPASASKPKAPRKPKPTPAPAPGE